MQRVKGNLESDNIEHTIVDDFQEASSTSLSTKESSLYAGVVAGKTVMPAEERNPWISFNNDQDDLEPFEEDNNVNSGDLFQSQLEQDNDAHSLFYGPLPEPKGPLAAKPVLKDVLDPSRAEQGVCGLRNLGNTCFMNSGLQCLLCNPHIVKHFLEEYTHKDSTELEFSTLTAQFAQLLRKVWSGQYTVLHPSSFKQTLGTYYSQFQDFRQHDCQEFLALLLDSLHVQLNQSKSVISPSREPSVDKPNEWEGHEGQEDRTHNELGALGGLGQDSIDEPMEQASPFPETLCDTSTTSQIGVENGSMRSNMEDSNDSMAVSSNSEDQVCRMRNKDLELDSEVLCTDSDDCTEDRLNNEVVIQPKGSVLNANHAKKATDTCDSIGEAQTNQMPTFDDYMKDTKTLNTNVLLEYEPTEVATDSEKYHKPDNTQHRGASPSAFGDYLDRDFLAAESLADEVISGVSLQGISAETLTSLVEKGEPDKGEPFKSLKETNLLVNYKEKYGGNEGCGKNILFSEMEADDSCESDSDIDNIKRMKIEEKIGAEKNYKIQKELHKKLKQNKRTSEELDTAEPSTSGYSSSKTSGSKEIDTFKKNDCVATPASSSVLCFSCLEKNYDTCPHCASGNEKQSNVLMNNTRRMKNVQPGSNAGNQGSGFGVAIEDTGLLSGFNNEQHMMARYMQEADREWVRYVQHNQSVVVDTFQGQFKSTVVCSECYHISVTFEPFMYLSVPIPHAMEKQICVIFVPCDNKQPVRYLVTLPKQGKVTQLKVALRSLIGEDESCDLVVAEVFQRHISRVLDDQMLLRYINDFHRTVYAFEMLPPPSLDDESNTEPSATSDMEQTSTNVNNMADVTSSVFVKHTPTQISSTITATIDCDVTVTSSTSHVAMSSSMVLTSAPKECAMEGEESAVSSTSPNQAASFEVLNNSLTNGAPSQSNLEFRTDVDWQTNLLSEKCDWLALSTNEESPLLGNTAVGGANALIDSSSMATTFEASQENSVNDDASEHPIARDQWMSCAICLEEMANNYASEKPTAMDQWKSCAICLEEMADSELMIHPNCGGTLCHNCLEISQKHYGGNGAFTCPVCSTPVSPGDEFIQLQCMVDYKPRTRILTVPVMQRQLSISSEGLPELALFGHPSLLYIASQLSGDTVYTSVDRVAPVLAPYTVVLTDAQGMRCSRCSFSDHCSGCTVARDQPVSLLPGDHLTIHYSGVELEQRNSAGRYVEHESVRQLRSDHSISLYDCFQAFTQSETLDEHNPWFCPRCRKNQCASKTITVWKYPQTLVVYLKRFVFEELVGTKIDSEVRFPVEGLDLCDYLSGPPPGNHSLQYDMHSCVCHFGGTASGHYTAYGKHPLTGAWYYFNDETSTRKTPGCQDHSSAYVLFYQQRGYKPEIQLDPRPKCAFTEVSAENDVTTSSGDVMKDTKTEDVKSTETEPDSTGESYFDFYN